MPRGTPPSAHLASLPPPPASCLINNNSIVDLSVKKNVNTNELIASLASARPLPITAALPPSLLPPPPPPAHIQPGVLQEVESCLSLSKYQQLLQVIEEMGREVRPVYAGSKTAAEKLKKNIALARLLVKEALVEMERASRHDK